MSFTALFASAHVEPRKTCSEQENSFASLANCVAGRACSPSFTFTMIAVSSMARPSRITCSTTLADDKRCVTARGLEIDDLDHRAAAHASPQPGATDKLPPDFTA